MKSVLLISTLLLTACAQDLHKLQEPDPRTIHGVDPAFSSQIQTYLDHKPSHKLDYDIPIQFGDLDGTTVGLCTRWSNGYRQIVVDKYYWEHRSDDNQKRSLIAHELGHCDLSLDHSPIISAIMYYINHGSQDYDGLFNIQHSLAAQGIDDDHACVEDIEVQSTENQF